VAFSPDGQTLASGSSDRTIVLWDVASGTAKARLTGHSASVHSVAFGPDGQTLASGSSDMTIMLWDVASGAAKATLKGHSGSVYSVAFGSDGQTLASSSTDRTIKLWDVSPVSAMTVAEASRMTGARLHGFEVAPLPDHAYDRGTLFVLVNGSAFPATSVPRQIDNPYLQMRWSKHHAAHWLPRAKQGDSEALYHLAVIRERLGQHGEAIRLHKRAAASTDPAGAQWAAESRQRLKIIPWLRK